MSNSQSGDFKTKYGVIHASNPGPFKDFPYDNVKTWTQTATRTITLQGPALRAFRAAEERYWDGLTKREKRKAGGRHIFITGHGYRSYALQKSLWDTDHQRFADPDLSNHVEAIAVDLDTGMPFFDKAKRALEEEGFHFAVDGEPWHGSFRLEG
jgi:hypothetical protein